MITPTRILKISGLNYENKTNKYIRKYVNITHYNHGGDPGVDGILGWIIRKWDVGDTDWTELAQDRDRWRALVNAVMNLRVQ